jgi:hypothetical protein
MYSVLAIVRQGFRIGAEVHHLKGVAAIVRGPLGGGRAIRVAPSKGTSRRPERTTRYGKISIRIESQRLPRSRRFQASLHLIAIHGRAPGSKDRSLRSRLALEYLEIARRIESCWRGLRERQSDRDE